MACNAPSDSKPNLLPVPVREEKDEKLRFGETNAARDDVFETARWADWNSSDDCGCVPIPGIVMSVTIRRRVLSIVVFASARLYNHGSATALFIAVNQMSGRV